MDQPPKNLRALTQERLLEITWEEDHVGRYWNRSLRGECPCANCVDEVRISQPATGVTGYHLSQSLSVNQAIQPYSEYSYRAVVRTVKMADRPGFNPHQVPPKSMSLVVNESNSLQGKADAL